MSLCVFKDTFALIGDRNEHRKTGTHTERMLCRIHSLLFFDCVTGAGAGAGANRQGQAGKTGTQDAGRMQTGCRIDAGRQVLQENAKKSGEGRQNAPPPFALLSRFR
jgi:hypothetical protein